MADDDPRQEALVVNIAEDEIEEQKESLEDWINYYEQELPELEDRIKVIDRVLRN